MKNASLVCCAVLGALAVVCGHAPADAQTSSLPRLSTRAATDTARHRLISRTFSQSDELLAPEPGQVNVHGAMPVGAAPLDAAPGAMMQPPPPMAPEGGTMTWPPQSLVGPPAHGHLPMHVHDPATCPQCRAEAAGCLGECGVCKKCGTICYGQCGCKCCDGTYRVFDPPLLRPLGVGIQGWVAGGTLYNPDSPLDRFNGPVTFNDRANEVQLNQLYLLAEREVDTGGDGWDWGGRVDVLYGSDWRFTPALGLETNADGSMNWNQDRRFYGVALPQLYGEVGFGDLKVKIGHFYTILGYEVVTAPDNFFSSHAYTMQYGEPFTHTGVLGSYDLTDNLALVSGLHRGWDQWEDANNTLGYLGGFTWSPWEGGTLAYGLTWSDEPTAVDAKNDRYLMSLVYTQQFLDAWTYVFQHDHGWQHDAFARGVSAEWYGINQYLLYDIDARWAVGLRGEWFRDDDGYRVAGFGSQGGEFTSRGWNGSGYAGNFYEIAAGVNYKPNSNIIIRSECRWDWYDGLPSATSATGPLPFDNGTEDQQFLIGSNLIIKY